MTSLRRLESITLIRKTVRNIVDKYDSRYWMLKDEKREFPIEFLEDLASHEIFGVNIPEEHGGAGYGLFEAAAVLEEIAMSPGVLLPLTPSTRLSLIIIY